MKQNISAPSFLITGSTGLIGSALVRHLVGLYPDARIMLPVRNTAKASAMFGAYSGISIHEFNLLTTDFDICGDVDNIIHCASPTASTYFVEHPIETFNTILQPTQHLLDYATCHTVKGFVYLSSLEVYGTISNAGDPITEDTLGHIDTQSSRSSYPLAKRAAEYLCRIYAQQYGVPVSIARLTQTTGPGVSFDDNRVINAFCRSAVMNKDIVLQTAGESSRPYCHIADAVSAILLLLEKGVKGEAYNVANESTYISAYDLAIFIRDHINPDINVRVELKENTPFPPPTFLPLSTSKLQSLGWQPSHNLETICRDVVESLQAHEPHPTFS